MINTSKTAESRQAYSPAPKPTNTLRQPKKGIFEYETDGKKALFRKQRLDLAKFKLSLAKKGLWLKEVGTDGNCFFRSVAD